MGSEQTLWLCFSTGCFAGWLADKVDGLDWPADCVNVFVDLGFTARQDYFNHFEPSQS